MHRRRQDLRTSTRDCIVCGGPRPSVLYESWTPAGLLSRRRLDVRRRWRCQVCGSRTPVTSVPDSASSSPPDGRGT